jgi:hypothetical protein
MKTRRSERLNDCFTGSQGSDSEKERAAVRARGDQAWSEIRAINYPETGRGVLMASSTPTDKGAIESGVRAAMQINMRHRTG